MGKGKRNRNKADRARSPKERVEFAVAELRKKRKMHEGCIERIDEKIENKEAELKAAA